MVLLLVNLLLLVIIPSFIYREVVGSLSSSAVPISLGLIYAFGATITTLQVLGALTEGLAVSVTFVSGSYIASAIYIWLAVDGGFLAVSQSGVNLVLSFRPLLFLLVLPSLFGAIRAPLNYLLDEHEAAKASPDTV